LEIELCILSAVSAYISDIAVAGVHISQSSGIKDSVAPRAWVVPTEVGLGLNEEHLKELVQNAVKERLSRYKWLKGGVEIVREVSSHLKRSEAITNSIVCLQIPKSLTGKVLKRELIQNFESRNLRDLKPTTEGTIARL
jgi:acyl-CoA synthetase (AMP-forming)/AMP-acid ligase II